MKIACVDNMNNMMFALTRYLRDFGHDVDLIINGPKYEHFDPYSDTYDDSYLNYTKYYDYDLRFASKKELLKQYSEYDILIGSSYSPYLCERMGRKLDIFVPHGSDFFSYPFTKLTYNPKSIKYFLIAKTQKKGIENTNIIHMDYTNSELEKNWSRFNFDGKRIIQPVPFIYRNQYETELSKKYKEKSNICKRLKIIREENDLIIFHHSSHQWKNPVYSLSQKRNDLLIKGFAKFVNNNSSYRAKLVMLEYGLDIKDSKILVENEGIKENVVWLPKSMRKDLILAMEYADIGAGEFGHSWFSYCTIFEFLSRGVPVMHYREDSLYKKYYPKMYPMYNAYSEDTIFSVLESVKNDKNKLKKIGSEGQKWFEKYVVANPLRYYNEYIDSKEFK